MDIESLVRFYAFLAVAGVASVSGFAMLWIRGRERIREFEARLEARVGIATPIPNSGGFGGGDREGLYGEWHRHT